MMTCPFGSEAVESSTSRMTAADLTAIAAYLKARLIVIGVGGIVGFGAQDALRASAAGLGTQRVRAAARPKGRLARVVCWSSLVRRRPRPCDVRAVQHGCDQNRDIHASCRLLVPTIIEARHAARRAEMLTACALGLSCHVPRFRDFGY